MTTLDNSSFAAVMATQDAARDRFNGLPSNLEADDFLAFRAEEERMSAACYAADCAIPTTWAEFTRLLDHMSCNGTSHIDDDNGRRLLCHARRLLNGEGC